MKIKLLLVFLFFQFSFSQIQKNKLDSISYYLELANYTFEEKFNTELAIKYTNKAIALSKNSNNNEKLMDCYYSLGTLYYENNNYNEAKLNFIRCSNYFETKKIISSKVAKTNYALGRLYLDKKDFKVSNLYFQKAFKIYNKLNISNATLLVDLQKGLTLKINNNLKDATSVFKNITLSDKDIENAKIEAFYQLSLISTTLKDYPKALKYATESYDLLEKSNSKANKKNIINHIILLSEKTKDFEITAFYLKKYVKLNSLLNTNNLQQNDLIIDKKSHDSFLEYTEKKEKEEINEIKSKRFSKLISIMSIVLIAILSLLSFSLYKNNKIRNFTYKMLQEKNKELTLQKEKAEFASSARAEFLSTVSHELRTPLNAINGITYLLLQEKPKDSQLNYLKSLEFSGNYLLNFINDILEINRLESNNVQVEKIKFNLIELVNNIKISFNEFLEKNNVTFNLDLQLNETKIFIGDPTKLSQILINLINNAIKFTKNGDVTLQILTKKSDSKKIVLTFIVQDNGIGIPENKIDTIFDSFSQGSVEVNRTYGGTGLGLAIVKKIIEVLKSEIHLESIENIGSKFYFDLEFEKANENTISSIDSKIVTSHENLKNRKVLLIEDNKINQMITKKMVENKGMICTIIDNGEDAVTEMRNKTYDIVLMDVHLPGINGTEATAEIRKFDTTTPIIALTAISLNENREMLLSYGMNDVVTKPFNPEHFYNVVSAYVKPLDV